MKPFIFLGLLLIAEASSATDSVDWQAACQRNSPIQRLEFNSRSGDPSNDDFSVSIHWRNQQLQKLSLPEAWYTPLQSWRHSLCQGVAVYPLRQGRQLLVLLNFDGRPGLDRFHLLLLDSQTQQVLAQHLNVGELPQKFRYRWQGDKLSVLMVKAYKGQSDGPDDLILGWREFAVKETQILMNWR